MKRFKNLAGVICEYNPMHAGHLWHLARTREQTRCDGLVLAMTGDFSQRGEPALYDKFVKAALALGAGADLVLEIPAPFAFAPADDFALYGIKILDSVGGLSVLSFGSGAGETESLERACDILGRETFSDGLKAELARGSSFPEAYARAAKQALAEAGLSQILDNSNDLLALSYLKALKHLKSPIRPHAVKRRGNYLDDALGTPFSQPITPNESPVLSAAAVRARLSEPEPWEALQSVLSPEVMGALRESLKNPFDPDIFFRLIRYRLENASEEELARTAGLAEGLESRFQRALSAPDFEAFLWAAGTRRYSLSRIRRTLLNLLLGIDQTTYDEAKAEPPLLRVLGVRRESEEILANVPGAVCAAARSRELTQGGRRILDWDVRAANLFDNCRKTPSSRNADFHRGLLKV